MTAGERTAVAARWTGLYRAEVDPDGWQRIHRLDPTTFTPPATDNLANRARMAAGVRALWQSGPGVLHLEGAGAADTAPYDLLVDGVRTHRLPAAGVHVHDVALPDLAPDSTVELWLPHFGDLRIRSAAFTGEDTLPAVEAGLRWLTYGSSLTQCQQADGPTETWPALVARSNGWHLTNLGLAGECQLDAAALSTIEQADVGFLSLCLGINSYNASAYSPRTYPGAVQSFLQAVRRAHPGIPIAVLTPVLSVPREEEVNAVGWTLSDYRKATAAVVTALQDDGDDRLHLVDGAALFSPAEAEARMPDTLHPDNLGYRLMAQRLGPVLAALAGED